MKRIVIAIAIFTSGILLASCAPQVAVSQGQIVVGTGDYSQIAGTWLGVVDQYNTSTVYSAQINFFSAPTENGQVATSNYPELGCGGILYARPAEGNTYVTLEEITFGGGCISGTTKKFTPTLTGELIYEYFNTPTSARGGDAVLVKQ
ncbi:MAG: hypothetical protein AAF708_21850 [Deinococcota bacterium]